MKPARNHLKAFAFLGEGDRALMAEFVTYLRNGVEKGYREDTIRTYTGQLAVYFRRCGYMPADGVIPLVTRVRVMQVLTNIDRRQASTRRNLLFAVKAFARFLRDWEAIDEGTYQAIADLKFKAKPTPNKPRLTDAEAEALMRHVLKTPQYSERERLTMLSLIALMGFTGLRNSEVCKLRLVDVDFDKGNIVVADGKGGKTRKVGLPERIAPLLKLYLKHRPETLAQTFFVGATGQPLDRDLVIKRLGRLSRSAGIKVGAHMLRRTFATRTAHRGVPLDKLQVVLGHADIQTTRGYVQTCDHEVVQEMRHW